MTSIMIMNDGQVPEAAPGPEARAAPGPEAGAVKPDTSPSTALVLRVFSVLFGFLVLGLCFLILAYNISLWERVRELEQKNLDLE